MRYTMPIHEFSYNKIKSGARKVGVHLFDKKCQQIKIGDYLDFINTSTNEHMECEVKGLGIFENFSDMIDSLTPQLLGYDNKEEIMIRLNRVYSKEQQAEHNVLGIFIKEVIPVVREKFRDEIER